LHFVCNQFQVCLAFCLYFASCLFEHCFAICFGFWLYFSNITSHLFESFLFVEIILQI
jgi:hypothetical protein